MQEIWKNIEGYDGYQVSNLGNVKSLNYNKTGKEKIMKLCKDKYGYLTLILYKEGKNKFMRVHRLVADAFIKNPNNLPQVNHRNEDKTDNRVENLEFCDAKYNMNFCTRNERSSKSKTNGKKSKKVICIETGVTYPSLSEVHRQFGFSESNISAACRGKYKQSYGYHWKFVDQFKIDQIFSNKYLKLKYFLYLYNEERSKASYYKKKLHSSRLMQKKPTLGKKKKYKFPEL